MAVREDPETRKKLDAAMAATNPRLERIAAAREKLEARIKARHPDSKAYRERLAEYDASEKMIKAAL